jgi:catechol 2,3-dioxygenase-like lactoylglutathione lyase family enzyme
MFARLNHIAIASDQYALNARFYSALFGMKASPNSRPARSSVVGDGYVGLNNIPRREGRCSGIDHFGIEVADIELALSRIKKFDPTLEYLKRPPVRPFAAYSAHDLDSNVFDLAERGSGDQKDVYADNAAGERPAARSISHFALRTRHAERCAQFYAEVFELTLLNRPNSPGFHLSDGRVTLLIMPWKITDYEAQDPARTGIEHIGFKVESIEAIKREMVELIGVNPHMQTKPLGYGSEGEARLKVFKQCPIGHFQLTDLEGCLIDVEEDGHAH